MFTDRSRVWIQLDARVDTDALVKLGRRVAILRSTFGVLLQTDTGYNLKAVQGCIPDAKFSSWAEYSPRRASRVIALFWRSPYSQ